MNEPSLDALENRIEAAIRALALERKVRLLTGAALFTLWPEPLIGLRQVALSDGPAGVRGTGFEFQPAILLPNATLLAQHWDAAVGAEVGALLAGEAAAQGVHVVLGPTINLHRSPLGGRLFEAYSEDPLLTGILAAAYVRGLQDNGVAATVKHFVANESETERRTVDCIVDERTLRELYLLAFEIVIADAKPWAVMAAYNRINGLPATEHAPLIDGILKREWGFDGVVMSDWGGVTSTAASANGGLDLVMPGPDGPWGERLVQAVRVGEVPESIVDEHVRRLLRLAGRVGAFGESRQYPDDLPAPSSPERRAVLRRFAAGGMTVLVNRDGTLPLRRGANVAVIGRHAIETVAQGGGSVHIRPPHLVTIGDGVIDALGPQQVTVVDGPEVRDQPAIFAPVGAMRDPVSGEPGIRITTVDASGCDLESRHIPAAEVLLYPGCWLEGAASLKLSTKLALAEPARIQICLRGSGEWTVDAGELHERFTVDPTEGERGPTIWTGEVDLSATADVTATVRPTGPTLLTLACRLQPRPAEEAIRAAVTAARRADLAVVVVGLTDEQETEEHDKSTLKLPGEQDALVSAVAAAAPRTVVVVNAATPVLMPWLDDVDAVLWAGLPGQEAGAAVAAALLGEIEPAGRLVTTFPAHDGDGPAWSTRPTDGQLPYVEGVGVGYRGWQTHDAKPLFWFGHGLGYTTWAYSNADLHVGNGHIDSVHVDVTNTGSHSGREVVQAYFRPAEPHEPVRLIGWAAIELDPGKTARVNVACDSRVQRLWDMSARTWRTMDAAGEVLLARGLGDIRVIISVSQRDPVAAGT